MNLSFFMHKLARFVTFELKIEEQLIPCYCLFVLEERKDDRVLLVSTVSMVLLQLLNAIIWNGPSVNDWGKQNKNSSKANRLLT